ncbi:hypothetical protein DFH29DRAFT_879497 [Suillus ampliporus]|nr:hypothetical protein DFH29DRAFT_879497 [Suillus ampliporus]
MARPVSCSLSHRIAHGYIATHTIENSPSILAQCKASVRCRVAHCLLVKQEPDEPRGTGGRKRTHGEREQTTSAAAEPVKEHQNGFDPLDEVSGELEQEEFNHSQPDDSELRGLDVQQQQDRRPQLEMDTNCDIHQGQTPPHSHPQGLPQHDDNDASAPHQSDERDAPAAPLNQRNRVKIETLAVLPKQRDAIVSAHVNGSASKKDLKEVKRYLENIDPQTVEKVYGEGKYIPWHGDGKSQSQTYITFQTKSMHTSGQPPKYVTIVARKRKTDAYVTYESSTWSESTKTIIDEMIKAIKV